MPAEVANLRATHELVTASTDANFCDGFGTYLFLANASASIAARTIQGRRELSQSCPVARG